MDRRTDNAQFSHQPLCLAYARSKFALADLRQRLERKAGFNPDQPRDDLGRWTDGGGGSGAGGSGQDDSSSPGAGRSVGGGDGTPQQSVQHDTTGDEPWSQVISGHRSDGSVAQQVLFGRDGSIIHAEYAAAGEENDWDERHTVVTPAGARIRFETDGATQTISDANTGETLARSTWGPDGPQPEATLQPAFVGPAAPAAVEAAAALFVWMSTRNGPDRTAVLGFRADDYKPGETPKAVPTWIGRLTRDETDRACPRHQEVQTRTDEVATRVREEGNYLTASHYGTRVHKYLKDQIDALDDPYFRAEVSLSKTNAEARYGGRGTIRIDILENVGNGTVCVYDIKTGRSGLSASRSVEIAGTVFLRYPDTKRIVLIETRPRR